MSNHVVTIDSHEIDKLLDTLSDDEFKRKILFDAVKAGAKVAGPIPLPTKINKYTVLKSPFVNKKSREQFEMRTHKRLIDISNATPKTIDSLQNLSLPSGVDAEIKM